MHTERRHWGMHNACSGAELLDWGAPRNDGRCLSEHIAVILVCSRFGLDVARWPRSRHAWRRQGQGHRSRCTCAAERAVRRTCFRRRISTFVCVGGEA